MSTVLLTPAPDGLRERVHQGTGGAFRWLDGPLPDDPAAVVVPDEQGQLPEVVLVDAQTAGLPAALKLAGRLAREHPALSVVLVGELDTEDRIAAMRAGVRDILAPDTPPAQIRHALDRALAGARRRSAALAGGEGSAAGGARGGRVIAVVSPKGGVGKTTVATNVAVGLARASRGSTVLVDLDLQFGDVTSGLGLEPEHTLPDALRGRAMDDSMILKTYLTEHASGLFVLAAPEVPGDATAITGEDVTRLLELLSAEFRYVVVDTAPGLSEHTLSVLDLATDMVMITNMDLPGVLALGKEMEILTELGMTSASRQVVLNFAERRSGMTLAEVEDALAARVDMVLPLHDAVPVSVNHGTPLLHGKANDPVSKHLQQLVSRYTAPKATTIKGGRLSGRHRGER